MKQKGTHPSWEIFFGKNPELLLKLAEISEINDYKPKECILSQQDKNRDFFYILEGQAKAFSLSSDGQEVWLDDIQTGFLLGEVAALGTGSRSATVVAKSKARVAKIKGIDFIELMKEYGSIGIAVSKLLVQRIEKTTIRMCELSSLSAGGRICAELLRLSDYEKVNMSQTCLINVIPPNTEIAVRVNSTRETVSRTMSDLETKGLIARQGAKVTIPSPDLLMDMIN